jgi:hypothetical protein
MRKSRWIIRLYHAQLIILLLGLYVYVLIFAVRYQHARLFILSAPLLAIVVGFSIPRSSLEARFVAGVAGGISFYFFMAISFWLTAGKALVPPLSSRRGLGVLLLFVLFGALHSAAVSVVFYYGAFVRDYYKRNARARSAERLGKQLDGTSTAGTTCVRPQCAEPGAWISGEATGEGKATSCVLVSVPAASEMRPRAEFGAFLNRRGLLGIGVEMRGLKGRKDMQSILNFDRRAERHAQRRELKPVGLKDRAERLKNMHCRPSLFAADSLRMQL